MMKYFIPIALALSFFSIESIQAASFDCSKALSKTERLICSDVDLSALDSSLGDLFKNLTMNQEIVAGQKRWLSDKRNLCESVNCLKEVYLERIDKLRSTKICPLEKANLKGSWIGKNGSVFEEMAFEEVGETKYFTSWIHHRPEMIGTWDLAQCTITIKHSIQESLRFELKVKMFSKSTLKVVDSDSGEIAEYLKVE